MERNPDWPQRLNAYVLTAQSRYAETGLSWGEFDCVTFVCDWVREATGVDPMTEYRGRYSTREEAAFLLRERGHGTLEAALEATFGAPEPASFAQRGDIAFRSKDKTCGIFIVQGARTRALFLGETGLMQIAIPNVDLCFRV